MTKKLKTVPLNKIKISDQFWNRYIHLVKDVLIPYQWDILNDRLPDVRQVIVLKTLRLRREKLTEILKGQYSRIQMWRNGWKR